MEGKVRTIRTVWYNVGQLSPGWDPGNASIQLGNVTPLAGPLPSHCLYSRSLTTMFPLRQNLIFKYCAASWDSITKTNLQTVTNYLEHIFYAKSRHFSS